jgi:hypothetical protein
MLLAQILFVDNTVKEGSPGRIEEAARDRVFDGLSACIRARSATNEAALARDDARFYATLFLLQTAFDTLFVPDEDIVTYDTASGAYHVPGRYDHCLRYLALSSRTITTTSYAEHILCYDLTTGWGDHIDRSTWDALNTHDYRALSHTTGTEHLFTMRDGRLSERMRPPFALASVRLAEEILNLKKRGEPLKILDIGAGSGALAIDLIMACTRLGLSVDEIAYEGLEPSAYMRRNFRENCERKIGATPFPIHWTLRQGSIEQVDARPPDYLNAVMLTVVVFSFSLHHCFHASVKRFLGIAPSNSSRTRCCCWRFQPPTVGPSCTVCGPRVKAPRIFTTSWTTGAGRHRLSGVSPSWRRKHRHPISPPWPVPEVHTAMLGACQAPEGVSSPLPCDGAFYGAAARDCTGSGPNAGGGTRRFEAAS